MKRKVILTLLLGMLFLVPFTNTSVKATEKQAQATCSGEFKIDGQSYTITLHDVSLWTCTKFKVASWFN